MKVFPIITIFGLFFSVAAHAQAVPEFNEVVYYEEPVVHHPYAPQVQKNRSPIENIVWRNKVRCGSNLKVKSYAHKEDGNWVGIDADICRVIAQAIIGDSRRIEMVDITPRNMEKALDEDKIDVMLSGLSYSAKTETSRKALSAGFLYYDHQMLMVNSDDSDDLENYRGKKICLSTDSDYFDNFDKYNTRYNLGLKYLTFRSLDKAKEAFLLNRCQMLSASGMTLNGLLKDLPNSRGKILKEHVNLYPVYAFVQRDNAELRLALKWIFNALFLAEQNNITAQSLQFFSTNDDPQLRNLLGDDPEMWNELKVKPRWLKETISQLGNYASIFDRNVGKDSEYKLDRDSGRLVKDGGTIYPLPFM